MTTKANPRPEYVHQWNEPPYKFKMPHTWKCQRCGCLWWRVWGPDQNLHNTYATVDHKQSTTIPKCEPAKLAERQVADLQHKIAWYHIMGLDAPNVLNKMQTELASAQSVLNTK